ncbi:MAG: ABC transporter permease [Rectinemataceae bacterium]
MAQFIARRLIMLIPVMIGVVFCTFLIAQVTPGDPAALALGPMATAEQIAQLRDRLGLNDPFFTQFFHYLGRVARGDLGLSIRGQTPVMEEILMRLPSTVELTALAMLFAIVMGVGAGLVAAITRSRAIDGAVMVTALVGLSVPNFWLAIMLISIFGVWLGWVSVIGGEGIRNLILPAFSLALAPGAVLARLTRSSMKEVVREDYVRTARAKGLSRRRVVNVHVLKNSMIPVVTVIGLQTAAMLGGAVFIESVFARPGLGRFAVNAISSRDFPQIQGVVLFLALVYSLVNLLVDVLYAVLDPRIGYQSKEVS